jgi:hypothetical protein
MSIVEGSTRGTDTEGVDESPSPADAGGDEGIAGASAMASQTRRYFFFLFPFSCGQGDVRLHTLSLLYLLRTPNVKLTLRFKVDVAKSSSERPSKSF